MNDCPNAEIRDLLPDLMHDRLDAGARAAVMAHVAECPDCQSEVELLRSVQETLIAHTPRIDLTWVAAALPRPSHAAPVPGIRSLPVGRRSWLDWRIAAAATLLVAGGSSIAVYGRSGSTASTAFVNADSSAAITTSTLNSVASVPESGLVAMTQPASAGEQTIAVAQVTADVADDPIANMDDSELEALLNDIDHLEAVPITEPDPVSLRIGGQAIGLTSIDPSAAIGPRGGV